MTSNPYVAYAAAPKLFDPANARVISRRHVKARKQHSCDGGVGPEHQIKPGEHYERTVRVDDEQGSVRTYRVCDWCLAGEWRVEEWIP